MSALQLCTEIAMKNIYDLMKLCKIVQQIWKSARFTSFAFKSKNVAKILKNCAWTCICVSMHFRNSEALVSWRLPAKQVTGDR
jgi:hypothetical protein